MYRRIIVLVAVATFSGLLFTPACDFLNRDRESPVGVSSSESDESGIQDSGEEREELEGVGQYNSFPWSWHLPFKGCWKMTQGYNTGTHKGMDVYATDWANGCGKEVLAAGSGYVLWAGDRKDGFGKTVLVECGPTGLADGRRYIVRYSHLSRIDVIPGWWLPRGWRIGLSGNTGYTQGTTGCHLHFTVYRGFYRGYGRVEGWSFPISYSTGIDGFNGNYGTWCSRM